MNEWIKTYVKLWPATLDLLSFLPWWALKKTGIIRVRKICTDNVYSSHIARMESQMLKLYSKTHNWNHIHTSTYDARHPDPQSVRMALICFSFCFQAFEVRGIRFRAECNVYSTHLPSTRPSVYHEAKRSYLRELGYELFVLF